MKPKCIPCGRYLKKALPNAVCLLLTQIGAQAQLAITEVMTSASTNHGAAMVTQGPDFFELTNFGTNTVDLTGYSWTDRGAERNAAPFMGLLLQPRESALFFRLRPGAVDTAEKFRLWWGLPETVQVRDWGLSPGLSAVQEWVEIYDPQTNLVDQVFLGPAQPGVTFVYDPATGLFGSLSVLGRGCDFQEAFRALTADDIGSPGCSIGPVGPSLFEQPVSQEVDACQNAVFSVRASGRPLPQFQWWRNDGPIPGATFNTLTLADTQVADSGRYWVQVKNSVGSQTSQVAILTVNTNPHVPTIMQNPQDARIYPGQSAAFNVVARGYPCLNYQWRTNGVLLPEANQGTLTITDAPLAPEGIVITVEVSNAIGATSASARLWVVAKPKLRITEVMASPSTNSLIDHRNWFEVTNYDTNAVSLLGWRFFDSPSALLNGLPAVVTQDVVLQPAQSAVFIERMTRDEFFAWWGDSNLPADLPIISYSGFGLSAFGEVLTLWNPAARDPEDFVARVMFYSSLPGVSMSWISTNANADMTEVPQDAELGKGCAFQATANPEDVGSPGFALGLPPRFISVTCGGGLTTLQWQADGQSTYCLQFRPDLQDASWETVTSCCATNGLLTASHTNVGGWPTGFYRLQTGTCP